MGHPGRWGRGSTLRFILYLLRYYFVSVHVGPKTANSNKQHGQHTGTLCSRAIELPAPPHHLHHLARDGRLGGAAGDGAL
eukprot:scaffold10249_cov87-Phaeocystis_antarctica.AAC.1